MHSASGSGGVVLYQDGECCGIHLGHHQRRPATGVPTPAPAFTPMAAAAPGPRPLRPAGPIHSIRPMPARPVSPMPVRPAAPMPVRFRHHRKRRRIRWGILSVVTLVALAAVVYFAKPDWVMPFFSNVASAWQKHWQVARADTQAVSAPDEWGIRSVRETRRFPEPRVERGSFRSSIDAEMVWIAPGSFKMGDQTGKGNADERPPREVRLTKGFWLGSTEVTQSQWRQIMPDNPSISKGNSLPVENVTWAEAMEFCRRLSERDRPGARLPVGAEYRLPTEAQWEYACRAGTAGDYAGGLDAMAWYDSNSEQQPHDVRTKKPNAWGLYDLHGNVWEWCLDYYAPVLPEGIDPEARIGTQRVIRGGSYSNPDNRCRSSIREKLSPDERRRNVGFRLAAVLP